MTDIKQALSAEEWADFLKAIDDANHWDAIEEKYRNKDPLREWGCEGGNEHAHAAIYLYGQPFGFTRERLCRLRKLHQALVDFDTGWIYNNGEDAINDLGSDLDRIEALLPPENK